MLPADAAADAAAAAALNLLLAAPSRDAIALVFSAAFRHRHDAGALLGAPAVRALSLPPDDAARLAAAAAGVLRRVLYESSELLSADAVAAALPPALDAGLRKYLATVRRGGARASQNAAGRALMIRRAPLPPPHSFFFPPSPAGARARSSRASRCRASRPCRGAWTRRRGRRSSRARPSRCCASRSACAPRRATRARRRRSRSSRSPCRPPRSAR